MYSTIHTSAWWRVCTKTTVRFSLGSFSNRMTFLRRYVVAAYFCSFRTVKKASFNVSETRVSVSSRTIAGSWSAALRGINTPTVKYGHCTQPHGPQGGSVLWGEAVRWVVAV